MDEWINESDCWIEERERQVNGLRLSLRVTMMQRPMVLTRGSVGGLVVLWRELDGRLRVLAMQSWQTLTGHGRLLKSSERAKPALNNIHTARIAPTARYIMLCAMSCYTVCHATISREHRRFLGTPDPLNKTPLHADVSHTLCCTIVPFCPPLLFSIFHFQFHCHYF